MKYQAGYAMTVPDSLVEFIPLQKAKLSQVTEHRAFSRTCQIVKLKAIMHLEQIITSECCGNKQIFNLFRCPYKNKYQVDYLMSFYYPKIPRTCRQFHEVELLPLKINQNKVFLDAQIVTLSHSPSYFYPLSLQLQFFYLLV